MLKPETPISNLLNHMQVEVLHSIDEISMIPLWIWNMLIHLKEQHNCFFIGCGDWKQLAPPEEEHIEFEKLTDC